MKRLIAEWEAQDSIVMVYPSRNMDWSCCIEEIEACYNGMIATMQPYTKIKLICHDRQEVEKKLPSMQNIELIEYVCDDTWVRDSGAISVCEDVHVVLYDFIFTAWGGKFEASRDNLLNQSIKEHYPYPLKTIDFILEGGGIESNGSGILLTTSRCMLNPNRNQLPKEEITKRLKSIFGLSEVLYLEHGYLSGDDTDSHIDTLARFIDEKTIVYVGCDNPLDEHYEELLAMQKELEAFAKVYGFELVRLPLPTPIYHDNERLPATYANFLITPKALFVPLYGVKEDEKALEIFRFLCHEREVIGVDARALIYQHGSLHCATMQIAL